MPKYAQEREPISDGVNLLISILVRYPEIASIRFDPDFHIMKLTFMVAGIVQTGELLAFRQKLLDSINAYRLLLGPAEKTADIQSSVYDSVTVVTIFRDVDTLSKGEIAMCISLLREQYRDSLVTDRNDNLHEEELLVQEEIIDNMLENVKTTPDSNSLVGIREDGRVLVFNK